MFTGIVETVGTVLATKSEHGGSTILTISECGAVLGDAHDGDSISINGTCLTITSFTPEQFVVSVSPETLRRTNLGNLKDRGHVNLERAVSASTRMGGHFVQGHVDTTAEIVTVQPDGDCLTFRLRPKDSGILRYIVEKGYVTLDGASLTITKVDDLAGIFDVMLITYTQDKVVMSQKQSGEHVNVEVDMVGKYVEKSVTGYFDGMGDGSTGGNGVLEKLVARIVDERLKKKAD
ncbi:uncharacterized protein KY384_000604 [Bacidia gigantensis]|uniref:uncharacterized protein n=1 Tax=Bacidia gigantensis TaxID=2732470 RepID=UPI001D03664C|nr:uncharacterized protein KY384_000604 [Bacidia gigantensis]KAG8525844.1 hypothetical protein KY384_000604 [Bacidia gigantensis]